MTACGFFLIVLGLLLSSSKSTNLRALSRVLGGSGFGIIVGLMCLWLWRVAP